MGACCSEEHEDLLDVTLDVLDLLADDVEADGLGEGAALADGHDITGSDTEGGGAVDGDGVMALLESVVFLDVMKVIASDDDRPVHFSRDDNTLEDSAADGHVARERALLVDVGALNGGLRGLEAYSKEKSVRVSNTVSRLQHKVIKQTRLWPNGLQKRARLGELTYRGQFFCRI